MTSNFEPKNGFRLTESINWNSDGLIPAVVQQHDTGQVLMLAWMNSEALTKTLSSGEAHYFSRSRNRQWHKGETSGNIQKIIEIRLDCDGDTILLQVEQAGVACHKGHKSCLFYSQKDGRIQSLPI